MAIQDERQLRTFLDGVSYPAHRDDLVEHATSNGAPHEVRSALQAMPPVEYGSRAEVMSSVHIDSGQSDAEKANERRHHTHSGLAETETDAPPNPITDEVGENRWS